jgi:hypothetical protein
MSRRRPPAKPPAYLRFVECGFSDRITFVLVKAGIDTPERLLSMAPDRVRLIPGIGETLIKEIDQYRASRNGLGVTNGGDGRRRAQNRRS